MNSACPPLLILNGLAMQHELQRKMLSSFLPFTGPVDGEEAQAKVSETILYVQTAPLLTSSVLRSPEC